MKTLLIFALVFSSLGYGQVDDAYFERIDSIDQFRRYQGKPLSNKFGQVSALKVVYSIRKNQLYYIQSVKYPYHIDFCTEYLGYYKGSFTFNYDNYTKTHKREFLLATINHYESQDLYTLEFSVADQITMQQVQKLYDRIQGSFALTDTIRLFLNTVGLENRYAMSGSNIPVVTVDEIYLGQQYQAIKTGVTYGTLRYYEVGKDAFDLWKDDIVILRGTPNELSPVSGVVSETFQTPLSHISILCQNRGTPFMAYKNIWSDSLVRSLEEKLVKLTVTETDYHIELAHPDSARAFFDKLKPTTTHQLEYDSTYKKLMPLVEMQHKKSRFIGAKAANFGELAKVLSKKNAKAKVPESAFAIPFHFYLEHIRSSGADTLITALLKIPVEERSKQQAHLKLIRERIKSHPVDRKLLSDINNTVKTLGSYRRMRFRSSTNAEDIDGFNGAGLYTSATGIIGDDSVKTVEKALKKVWSSVWNERAFFERAYFGMDQQNVVMGILVHRSFPNESANGVAITKNIYRPEALGNIINVQTGEIPVVNPPEGVICDQLVCYSDAENTFYDPKRIIEYVSHSSEIEGTVLTDKEVITLSRELAKIEKHFYRRVEKYWTKYTYEAFGLDLEFKIDGDTRQIYIKQVRPYNL